MQSSYITTTTKNLWDYRSWQKSTSVDSQLSPEEKPTHASTVVAIDCTDRLGIDGQYLIKCPKLLGKKKAMNSFAAFPLCRSL